MGTSGEGLVEEPHRVHDVRGQAGAERGEALDDLVDIERLAPCVGELAVLGHGADLHVLGERAGVEHVSGPQADPPGLVGVGRSDPLEGGADLVVAPHRLGDRILRLVPREDQMGPAGHLEPATGDPAGLEGVDLAEQGRQIDDDAVADHRHDVVVQDPARHELEGVTLAGDHHRVSGVVPTLVAHDVGVLLRQQVDDLGLALVTPLGADDDGDGHGEPTLLRYRRPAMETVMRRLTWSRMSEPERAALCSRGLADIFDPALRASIAELIEDVRMRGDAAVCDALARFDGVEVEPAGLRVGPDEIAAADVSPAVDAALDDAIAHCQAFNEQVMDRAAGWDFEAEPGLRVGEKITPITSAGLFVPSGKASYPSVAYQLGVPARVAGVPQVVLVVPPVPGGAGRGRAGRRHGRPGGARRLPQARHRRRVPRQRAGGRRRPRVRHRDDPVRPQGRRAGLARGRLRPSRTAALRRGDDDAARSDREPGDRRRLRRPGPARRRPAHRGRART